MIKRALNFRKSKWAVLSLVALVTLSLSFVSCSSDDDDEASLFLENHGGTLWNFSEQISGTSLYLRINSSESNPFEIWLKWPGSSCYDHEGVDDSETPEVLENTKNTLKLRVDDSATEYTIVTLSVSGDFLTISYEYFEDGSMVEEESVILARSSDNVNDLQLCV